MPKFMLVAVLVLLSAHSLPAIMVGEKGPNFKFNKSWNTPEGFKELDDYRDKFVLVIRWAAWSKSCLDRIPHLEKLNTNLREKGFEICATSDEAMGDLAKIMILEHKVKFGVVAANIIKLYENPGLPHGWLLDRSGVCVWRGNPHDLAETEVERRLLNSPPLKVDRALSRELNAAVKHYDKGDIGRALAEATKVSNSAVADKLKEDCTYMLNLCGKHVTAFENRMKEAGRNLVEKVKVMEEGAVRLRGSEIGTKWESDVKELKKSKDYEASVELNKIKAEIDSLPWSTLHKRFSELARKYPETEAAKEAEELAKKYKED